MPAVREIESQRSAMERRSAANIKLALLLGGVAIGIFLLALWKYRPA